jgi:hypothetical protein
MTSTETKIPVREQLGRIVRETWVAWAQEQPDPKPGWLLGWDDLRDDEREVDMRIADAIADRVKPDRMWENAYMDVQRVLDEALGTEEKDGAGSGIAADVWLLANQRDEARVKLAAITAHCRRRTEWTSGRPDTLVEALVKAHDIMKIINPEETS